MNKFLQFTKFAKSLLDKGFATKNERAELETKFNDMSDEEQEAAADVAAKVKALPDTEPDGDGAGDDAGDADKAQQEIQNGIKQLLQTQGEAIEAKLNKQILAMKAEIKEWLEEQKDLASKKVGLYHPEVREKRKKQNEYLRSFIGALYLGDIGKLEEISNMSRKELTTDSTGTPFGGYVVDSELSAEIRHLATEYGVARREMTALQITKNSYKANDLATDPTVYWVDEGTVVKSTEVVLGQEELKLKKLGAIVALTRELLEDQEVDLFSFIAGRVAEGFAEAEDLAFFTGDGTSSFGSFTGILNAQGVNEVVMTGRTTFASMTADDLLDMQDATPSGAMTNAKYYLHRTILSIVRKLKDNQGQYIYQRPSEDTPGQIWDKPYVLVEAMPSKNDSAADTPFVAFGDLRKACILGFKGAIAADRFNAGSIRNVADNADINLITTDREAVRWIERVGMITVLPQCITVLKTDEPS